MEQRQIIDAITAALQSTVASGGFRRYTGENSERLAVELSRRMAASEVLLTSSGTAAMELALRAVGVTAGDEVLLSAYDYPGNFWAIERVGARPVLLDTEPNSWRFNVDTLTHVLGSEFAYKAIIVSHLHGQLQDVAQLRAWCERVNLSLIEDACQAVGATIAGEPAGSFGHASIISFGGGKVLSAGRGGALLTSDAQIAQRARILSGGGSGPYALSELQATAVSAQLPWLDQIVVDGRNYFAAIAQCLQNSQRVCVPFAGDVAHTSFYQAGFITGGLSSGRSLPAADPADSAFEMSARERAPESDSIGVNNQSAVVEALRAVGIPAGIGFSGFHRRSNKRCRHAQALSSAAKLAKETVTIHHSAAWEPGLPATRVAEILDDATKC